MDTQKGNGRHDTSARVAALKSEAANQANEIFSADTKRAANATVDKADTVRSDINDLASAASDTAHKGAADIGRASSKIKSDAIAGAKDIANESANKLNDLSVAAKDAANDSVSRFANEIARNPLTSVMIAAAVGYLTAIVTRSDRR